MVESNAPEKKFVMEEYLEVKLECREDIVPTSTAESRGQDQDMHLSKKLMYSFQCDQCEFAASKPAYLKQHKASKHEGIKLSCDQCDSFFAFPSSLIRHKETKHQGTTYPCDECMYVATTLTYLKTHKVVKHCGLRYHCDQCEFNATTVWNLKTHKSTKHEGLRYPCDKCKYSATRPSDLKRHKISKHRLKSLHSIENSESEIKFINSEVGGREVSTSVAAKSPDQVKVLTCDQCDRLLAVNSDLSFHKETHKVTSEYPCDHKKRRKHN